MKKLLFIFALMFGAMFASCGNSTKTIEQTDSVKVDTTIVVDTIDSASVDSVLVNSIRG